MQLLLLPVSKIWMTCDVEVLNVSDSSLLTLIVKGVAFSLLKSFRLSYTTPSFGPKVLQHCNIKF